MSEGLRHLRGKLLKQIQTTEPGSVAAGPYLFVFERASERGETVTHVAFALRLVSCPAERDWDRRRDESERRGLALQTDFINSLFCPDPERTLAVRYLSTPQVGAVGAGRVDVVLLAKQRAVSAEGARQEGMVLFREIRALLAGSMPDHEWQVATDETEFRRLWEPFPWTTAHVAEIRRREDRVRLETLRPRPCLGRGRPREDVQDAAEGVYLVHPFVPRFSSLGRVLRMLLMHPHPVLWQVSLTPVWLSLLEEEALEGEIAKCEAYLREAGATPSPSFPSQTVLHRRALAMVHALVGQLVRLQDAPFLLRMSLASPEPLPRTLLEALGVEATGPVSGSLEHLGGGYDVLFASDSESARQARDSASWLEPAAWGGSLAPAGLERVRSLVDAVESAGVFSLPVATGDGLPGIDVRAARSRHLPREVAALSQGPDAGTHLLLGSNPYLGLPQPVRLADRDRRHHTYLVGQTGTGKTTLLKQMALADMAAGRGLAVIDPHGDLFEDLLGSIPEHRREDVVVVDPTDIEFPIGLNVLECSDDDSRYAMAREMRGVMERLMGDQYQHQAAEYTGPVFYQHMQMNMLLAMSDPDDPGTLLEFYQIFQSKDYWKRWLPLRWGDAKLNRWVKLLEGTDYTRRGSDNAATMGEYLSTKFEDFVFDPRLRLIFGQKRSSVDIRALMNDGKILLVNLAKGKLTEANARFLGMVLMAMIQSAAMARVHLPIEKRRPFYLYVDEFQSVATENFILMLSEARKFGLGLVLANQFLSQIKDSRITQSIFGNVGTLIAFRVSTADAEMLEPQFAPYFDRHDLTNLSNWSACVKTQVSGQVVTPFSLRTRGPDVGPEAAVFEAVKARSRKRYGRPRADVEAEIEEGLLGLRERKERATTQPEPETTDKLKLALDEIMGRDDRA
ncbi:hypothetical protein THIOKS1860010 [Thiocapsa sp. KS1]|nr:type IV secretion system DNA-binding domain-containing protein [Thiocapsa sp. KS1]CRI67841.1 hypothetical protein THIOKS1860010 [Thiocapsa sp. KS1]